MAAHDEDHYGKFTRRVLWHAFESTPPEMEAYEQHQRIASNVEGLISEARAHGMVHP